MKFLTALNIAYFLHSGFFSNLRLPWKTEGTLKFFTVLNIFFIIQDFWATCACPEKQSVRWKFSLDWIYFYIQDFWATGACPENRVCPENFQARGVATLPDYPLRVPMHKIIDIGNFVRRSLSERDGRILLLNSWTPLSSYDFCVVHTSFQKLRFHVRWLEEFKW